MKLVVCIDGTWNYASTRTNVWKLKQDLDCSPESDTQATYIEGIGTVTGDELLGGMFAADFPRPLGLAYRWLTKKVLNAPEGEEISVYVFGFSRGAYISHTLSWLLSEVGIPSKFANAIPIAEAYANKDTKAVERLKSEGVLPSPKIEMLGLWDAVSSPHDFFKGYHDGERAPNVELIYHAMATDERRTLFGVMQYSPAPKVVQSWFSGVHMDVGGGYPESECDLSDIALEWMKRNAERHGLKFVNPAESRPHKCDFASIAKIHNEETPLDPIKPRVYLDGEVIDPSVRDRVNTQVGYFPSIAEVPSTLSGWLKGLASIV
ncbi:MAG: DUF2235 domain-containing protein [Kiritimatiellae bacterium]|nr:DUF2235 domain-containing protein [Kiritimatiellia bacterium]